MSDSFDWLLDLLGRAAKAAETNAALEWSTPKASENMVNSLRATIADKLDDGPPPPPKKAREIISCSECFEQITVTTSGFVAYHGPRDERCPGSGRPIGTVHKPLKEALT